jgi:hypothetical protein
MAGFEWLRFGRFLNFSATVLNAESAPNKLTDQSRSGMTVKTGADLQVLRKQAAERFTAIAMQYVPEGWTVEYRKTLSGLCIFDRRVIQAPRPVTRKALYIFLHECAHAHLHREGGKARHVMEMEAERWAHEQMRAHGIAVPRRQTQGAKWNVARQIRRDVAGGMLSIDPQARRFAR